MPNDIKLQEGHPVDENLRPIKVGGKSTALELAQNGNGARITGGLEVSDEIRGNLTTNNITSSGLTINDSGDITLDSGTGKFISKYDGTEFSVADSAYAGMIIGYTDIGLDELHTTLALTVTVSGLIIPTNEFKVAFVIPPSGKVLIEFQIQYSSGSTGSGTLHAGLSTTDKDTGYTELEDFHQKMFDDISSRNGSTTVNGSWTLTGLTAGDSEELWIGFASNSVVGSPQIQWGGNTSNRYPDFIMKATALPATIYTGT